MLDQCRPPLPFRPPIAPPPEPTGVDPPEDAEDPHLAAHLAKGERRAAGTIWRRNPREQGLIGLTDAIGRFVVQVCTRGGNQSFHTTRSFDPATCELLYVLTDEYDRYLIPTAEVRAGHSLTLGARMAPFLLPCTPEARGLP